MSGEVKVVGLEEMGGTMDMFAQALQKRAVRNATRAGARVFRDGMKARVKVDTGGIRDNIIIKDYPLRREGDYKALIGVRYSGKVAAKSRRPGKAPSSQDPGVYAGFLELGRPGAKGHTHQAAQPFMRPTFDQASGKAEEAFVASVKGDSEIGRFIK